MDIVSSVPPSAEDIQYERPFVFQVEGIEFKLKPLTAFDYVTANEDSNIYFNTLLSSHAFTEEVSEEQKNELIGKSKIELMKEKTSIFKMMIRFAEPINPFIKLKSIIRYNRRYWWTPSRWKYNLVDWLGTNISLLELERLVAYFLGYCSIVKKNILQMRAKGITSLIPESNVTSFPSAKPFDPWDSLSPGGL